MSSTHQRPCRVLFVCLGNICRSPMAAAMAQDMLGAPIAAESAGLNPLHDAATAEAVEVMRERGLDLTGHRSRDVHELDLEPFDLVVALTPAIAARMPHMDGPERLVVWDIDDPYGGDLAVYRSCASAIEDQLRTLPIASTAGAG